MYVKRMGRKSMAAVKKVVPVPERRRDPFTEVVDYEDLVTARDLIKRGQNEAYWKKYPMPAPPLGHIPWEITRQIATFLLPLIAIFACVKFGGWGTLWVTIPLGFLFGWQMDRSLNADIEKTRQRDESIDRGRYRAVQILNAHLGIPRDEITLEMIIKMAKDCDWFEKAVEKRRKELKEAESEKLLAFGRRLDAIRSRSNDPHSVSSQAGVTAGSVTSRADEEDTSSYDMYSGSYDNYPMVNPSSGLPMTPGGLAIDVAGNAFGSGGFDH